MFKFWPIHILSQIREAQNPKLFHSIFWSYLVFRNPKSIQDVMREAPCQFVPSTLRSISLESLRNVGQCMYDPLKVVTNYGHSSLLFHSMTTNKKN